MRYPTLTEKDLAGLPQKLLNELNQQQMVKQPRTIKARTFLLTIAALPDAFSIDQALIKHWVLHGEVLKQITMRARLDRLAKLGQVKLHPTTPKVFIKRNQ